MKTHFNVYNNYQSLTLLGLNKEATSTKSITPHIAPIPTEQANAYWLGRPDANGQLPERHISDGTGVPCRHCLNNVPAGQPFLVLSYRAFDELQPYAESGPIFLHAERSEAYHDSSKIPEMYLDGEQRIVRGYDKAGRIIYGTGKVVEPGDIAHYAAELLIDANVGYVHVKSAQNNCYSFRIDRA